MSSSGGKFMPIKKAEKEEIKEIEEIIKKVSNLLKKKYKINSVLSALCVMVVQSYQDIGLGKVDLVDFISAEWDLCEKVKNE